MTRRSFLMLAVIFACCTLASCGWIRSVDSDASYQGGHIQTLCYPDFLSDQKGNGYELHYYSTAVFNSQGDKSNVSRTGYLVALTYTGGDSVLCKTVEFRGMDLSRLDEKKAEESRLSAAGDQVFSGSTSNYGARSIYYIAYMDSDGQRQSLSFGASSDGPDKPVVYQRLYVYVTEGNMRYSISFQDFVSQPDEQTVWTCISRASSYFNRLIK